MNDDVDNEISFINSKHKVYNDYMSHLQTPINMRMVLIDGQTQRSRKYH